MGMSSSTVWGPTALASPTHSPCGATVGYFLRQVLDMNPDSSSTRQQAALNYQLLFEGKSLSRGRCCRAGDRQHTDNLSQVSRVTPPCIGEHAMASLLLVFNLLGLFPFTSGIQSCCPTLASSPRTYTFLCVLDPVVFACTESTLRPFLDDGDLAWTRALPGVIRKGGWTHPSSNSSHGRIQNLPSAFPPTHSKICN